MSELGPDAGFWGARIAGAFAGSAISLIYLLPEGRREAAGRLVTGVTTGLIFGGPTGLWLARTLDLDSDLSGSDVMLAGSALASLCAWWALGILARVAARWGGKG
ncbi:DUF6107 family protein [Rhizobium sp. RU36D]|uniref:DUF6107 family protein n=1 Tax=Rhizobium sp. RU36D TaxID=1907415 RepID=UPI000A03A508|nr:DUF6107 family protein [Rhizobium sp. RU36D]